MEVPDSRLAGSVGGHGEVRGLFSLLSLLMALDFSLKESCIETLFLWKCLSVQMIESIIKREVWWSKGNYLNGLAYPLDLEIIKL